ncbi:MAG: hypothetical protein H5T64_07560 [Chloroflexi bacterium]|nr:hypothetical protein [Chloroflexota bacterium]
MSVRFFRYVTKDKILALSDHLSLDPKRNKIAITLLEYGPDNKARTTLRHFVDPDAFKVVCWDILLGTFTEWKDYKGSPDKEGNLVARVLSLVKDKNYRNPYVLRLEQGPGERMGAGAVRMVGKPAAELALLLPEFDARRLAIATLDYIRAWEIIHFREREKVSEQERAERLQDQARS